MVGGDCLRVDKNGTAYRGLIFLNNLVARKFLPSVTIFNLSGGMRVAMGSAVNIFLTVLTYFNIFWKFRKPQISTVILIPHNSRNCFYKLISLLKS
ncbi:MAG TPA: hypothetical protein DCS91_18825 [Microcoleaceae bacterium UBA11344]|nr:hypothetical protein [Microcoleaceae cyanobacterium UBA11344]